MEESRKKQIRYTAIVLAAGSGSRMHSEVKKQFMELSGVPLVVHSLRQFEAHELIDSVILVTGREDLEYALSMTMKYELRKVKNIVEGGSQRFRSVYNGLKTVNPETDYVLIHDGARPLLSRELITRCCTEVLLSRACVCAVPVKDTIKECDGDGFAARTLDRSRLFAVQTPQTFSYPVFLSAYQKLYETIEAYHPDESKITDDAMIVESMSDQQVRIIPGEYRNIKVTTPEDLLIAEALLRAEGSL